MGTRTRGFVDYHVADVARRDSLQMLQLLSVTIPACLAVEQYWQANDPFHEPDATDSWGVYQRGGDDVRGWWFVGPGGMGIRFGLRVAEIYAQARWRGFLTIPALRKVHRSAFAAIAQSADATGILYVPDYAWELSEAMVSEASFDQCLRLDGGLLGTGPRELGRDQHACSR